MLLAMHGKQLFSALALGCCAAFVAVSCASARPTAEQARAVLLNLKLAAAIAVS